MWLKNDFSTYFNPRSEVKYLHFILVFLLIDIQTTSHSFFFGWKMDRALRKTERGRGETEELEEIEFPGKPSLKT